MRLLELTVVGLTRDCFLLSKQMLGSQTSGARLLTRHIQQEEAKKQQGMYVHVCIEQGICIQCIFCRMRVLHSIAD